MPGKRSLNQFPVFFLNYRINFNSVKDDPTIMQKAVITKLILSLFFFGIFHFQYSSAQYSEKDFICYTIKDGLSNNYINCLQQDNRGYLWAGTDEGLNRFDGNSFNNHYQGSASLPLPSSHIFNLKMMGARQLGIISRSGFQILNTEAFTIKNYFVPGNGSFNRYRNGAWDAALMADRSLALTTNTGFYVFSPDGKLNFQHEVYKEADIGLKRIRFGREIFPINEQDYLVYTEDYDLGHYNAEKKIFRQVDPSEKEWNPFYNPITSAPEFGHWISKNQLNSNEFVFLLYQKDSIIYYNHALKKRVASPLPFHTKEEFHYKSKVCMINDSVFAINCMTSGFFLFHINRQSGKITIANKRMLPVHTINCLLLDKDNRLWAGTSSGLLQQRLNHPFIKNLYFPPLPEDKTDVGFTGAFRHKNKLYLGRYSDISGLLIIDTATMKVERRINFFNEKHRWNETGSMEMYHADTIWLGNPEGLIWFDTRSDKYGKVLIPGVGYQFYQGIMAPPGPDGNAWINTLLGNKVLRYHISQRTFELFSDSTVPALPFKKIKDIVYDAYGDVWISGHSLARWNNSKHEFDTLIRGYAGKNKFNENIIAISADKQGSLWFHNEMNGMLEYRIKEKIFVPYTIADGLPSEVFESISPVCDNLLWLASQAHLTCFDTRTKKITVYGPEDGMPEVKPSSHHIYFDSATQNMYLLFRNNVVIFPLHPAKYIDNSSGLVVEEIAVNKDKTIFFPKNGIRLKHYDNNLSIRFSVIDFEAGHSYHFSYKLDGNGSWVDLEQQRIISLTGLSPGRYKIHLKAVGKPGEEKITELSFVIAPPFWNTWWFLAGCILLLSSLLYYLYRKRIRQVRQKANLDKLLVQTEMKALHAQMNPHFIFNCLNSIREMILSNENKEASHFLGKFAQLIRMTLNQSGQSFISLRNTMDYLQRYLEMEQIRNSNFTCRILADDELDPDETVIPPMMIQPFIENSIWHGVSGRKKNININIDFKKMDNRVLCIIDDNGIGIEQSLQSKKKDGSIHHSVGIDNIRNRIRLLNEKYNLQCSVTIQDKITLPGYAETGTLVTLQLPLEIAIE